MTAEFAKVALQSLSPVELLQRLVRFDTTNPPGNERECIDYLAGLLDEIGCPATLLGRSASRPNLVARLPGAGSAPPLLLYGHVDVVNTANQHWQHPPFEGRLVDGYVWGRGALDMKGGIVMMLNAIARAKAENVPLPGDVLLALVCDEENGGDEGARYLVENHADLFKGVRYALGEFGGFSYHIGRSRFYPIMVAEKQTCHLRARVRGPGGHGALQQEGGAMGVLARFLQKVESRRLPVHVTSTASQMARAIASGLPFPASGLLRLMPVSGLTGAVLGLMGRKGLAFQPLFRNTVTPTMVHGGHAVNVAPSEVVVDLDGRLLPGQAPDGLLAELEPFLEGGVELEVARYEPGPAEPDMGLFDTLAGILREADPEGTPVPMLLPAATDARFFSRLGIQTYGYLPMRLPKDFDFSRTVHGPDERIPVEALDFGGEAMYRALRSFGQG